MLIMLRPGSPANTILSIGIPGGEGGSYYMQGVWEGGGGTLT